MHSIRTRVLDDTSLPGTRGSGRTPRFESLMRRSARALRGSDARVPAERADRLGAWRARDRRGSSSARRQPCLGAHGAELWLKSGLEAHARSVVPGCRPGEPSLCAGVHGDRSSVRQGRGQRRGGLGCASRFPTGRSSFSGALALLGRPAGRSLPDGRDQADDGDRRARSRLHPERAARRTRSRRRMLGGARTNRAPGPSRAAAPSRSTLFAGLDISGGFGRPTRVGGDYYGYVAMADGSLGIAIADVAGTAWARRSTWRSRRAHCSRKRATSSSAGDVLRPASTKFWRSTSPPPTCSPRSFSRGSSRTDVASSGRTPGHNPPLLLRANRRGRAAGSRAARHSGSSPGPAGATSINASAPDDVSCFTPMGSSRRGTVRGSSSGRSGSIEAARRPAASTPRRFGENVLEALCPAHRCDARRRRRHARRRDAALRSRRTHERRRTESSSSTTTPSSGGLSSSSCSEEGYQPATAADTEEGLRALESCPPDLIFLDVTMPGKDGLTWCAELKSDPRYARDPDRAAVRARTGARPRAGAWRRVPRSLMTKALFAASSSKRRVVRQLLGRG